MVVGPQEGKTPLFTSKGEINSTFSKATFEVLGPTRQELFEELQKYIQKDERIAEDENEDPAIRERARKD